MTENLRRLGKEIKIPLLTDAEGFTGRECPNKACEKYFKVKFGTGLPGSKLPCHCPYCGHTAPHDQFYTKEQIEYVKSAAKRKLSDAIFKDLKKLEFEHKPRGAFGIGFSMKVNRGTPIPIQYYREKDLETLLECQSCTLHYGIYGLFAICPDCGQHNSLQILEKNIEVVKKMIALASGTPSEIGERLIENALEDCVSAFDGFGRELCRIYSAKAADPAKALKSSFQNLVVSRQFVMDNFGFDFGGVASTNEWHSVVLAFQKRHVVAHKMGVIDDDYIRKSGDLNAVLGHKIAITTQEVEATATTLLTLARHLEQSFRGLA